MVKKNVDKQGLDEASLSSINDAPDDIIAHASGIGGDHLLEAIPKFIKAKNEKVFEGQNNTWIIMGRDRPASRMSGYGGIGDTQCGSIDIVVGRMSASPRSDAYVDPDFYKDAARILISQKSDIDNNFNLVAGKVGNSLAKSAIAIKADAVRLIAREGIKLVTGTDALNSQGGKVDTTLGIDLIAGNRAEELQPIPKGENLTIALERLLKHVESLSGILSTFMQAQMKFNTAAGSHFHVSPFFGNPTTPSAVLGTAATETQMNQLQDCVIGLQKFKANLAAYKNSYLRTTGKKYINSRYNSVN